MKRLQLRALSRRPASAWRRRRRQTKRQAERLVRRYSGFHLRHVGAQARPHLPSCHRGERASSNSDGPMPIRRRAFICAAHGDFSTLPEAERTMASVTATPWIISSVGIGYGRRPAPRAQTRRARRASTSSRSASQISAGSLDGLEVAGAEQPRAALLRGGAGHVGHAFEPHPAFGAEHLKAEPGPGRGHRAQIARHASFIRKRMRGRVVGVHRDDAPETLAEDVIDRDRRGRSCRRSRERPSA